MHRSTSLITIALVGSLAGCAGPNRGAAPEIAAPEVTLPFIQQVSCEEFRVVLRKAPASDGMLLVDGAPQQTVDLRPGEGVTIMAPGGFAERYELLRIDGDIAMFRRLTREDMTAAGRGVRTEAEVVRVRATDDASPVDAD